MHIKKQEVVMKLAVTVAFFMACSASFIIAKQIEKKGSFGVVIHKNFVKFSYVITYLGDSYKENHHAFRLDFEDNKGYNLSSEIEEEKTILKNRKNETIQGIVEIKSVRSVILLFPKNDDEPLRGKTTLYTVILGYKLKKDINI
jgi:hypothetical protein